MKADIVGLISLYSTSALMECKITALWSIFLPVYGLLIFDIGIQSNKYTISCEEVLIILSFVSARISKARR